jgi:hypothetical protein
MPLSRRYSRLSFLVLAIGLASSASEEHQQECDAAEGTCRSDRDSSSSSSSSSSDSARLPREDDDIPPQVPQPPQRIDCGVYMAPSTLGNYTNLGMFTAKPMHRGDVVPFPEIAIPLLWRDWGEHPPYAYGDGTLWDRYIWEGQVAGLESFHDTERHQHRAVFVPGVGCTVNSMLDLRNIASTQGSTYDPLVPRSNPAAGAFTPYHASKTTVIRSIPAGSELLASYGDSWIPWIPDAAVTQDQYLDAADEFLRDVLVWMTDMKRKHGDAFVRADNTLLLDRLWKLTTNFPHSSRTFSVLPKEVDWTALLLLVPSELEQELEEGTDTDTSTKTEASPKPPETREYWRDQQVVSLEWLHQHGKCQDHLRPGVSTIPNAGRGAFATRDLPKGTIVGYAPLIHVGARFYDFATIQYNHTTPHYSKPDLVLNYSFGHKESTLLLTPYGAMVNYINHASKKKANVKVQWPSSDDKTTIDLVAHKPEWLTKDVNYLRDTTTKIGLSFDYVALRDIQEGEEVVMDYGDDWQHAWDNHVAHWESPADAETHVHSSDYPKLQPLTTSSERNSDSNAAYPPNLITLCVESYRQEGSRYVFVPALRQTEERVHCEVVDRSTTTTTSPTSPSSSGDYEYTVQMTLPNSGQRITVHGVTRPQGIDLFDKVFSQDWHLPQAFRHNLYVPEDVFPESWKNLKPQA